MVPVPTFEKVMVPVPTLERKVRDFIDCSKIPAQRLNRLADGFLKLNSWA
jgi:hypothetical protein